MDDNEFSADALQQLTYCLCYLYARATRSVSIVPAVVEYCIHRVFPDENPYSPFNAISHLQYYADLVCTRARLYFRDVDWSDVGSSTSLTMDGWRERWKQVRREVAAGMYYSKFLASVRFLPATWSR